MNKCWRDNQNAINKRPLQKKSLSVLVLKIIFVIIKKYIKSNKQQSNLSFFYCMIMVTGPSFSNLLHFHIIQNSVCTFFAKILHSGQQIVHTEELLFLA
jgi:hypothetical protein